MTMREPHPNGGFVCAAVSPDGVVCTKKEHGGGFTGRSTPHHARGTQTRWWSPGQERPPARPWDVGDMSEGEYQAYGRYGY